MNKTDFLTCNIYIVELKRTVNSDKWTSDIKFQFRGATLRALSFLSTLGITKVGKIQYYTGFVNDDIQNEVEKLKLQRNLRDTSIIGKKSLVGVKAEETLEWDSDKVKIFGKEYLHHKIKLQVNCNNLAVGNIDVKDN